MQQEGETSQAASAGRFLTRGGAGNRTQRCGKTVGLQYQAVLLAGVNDDAAVLGELSRRLFAAGTLPYYLHQLDRVAGAAHFAVDDATALDLHARLLATLPGYLVPKLVRENAGASSKTPLHD